MRFFLVFNFFLFSFGQIFRITLFDRQINFYLYEISLCLFLMILFFKLKLSPLFFFLREDRNFFLFPVVLGVSYLINFFEFNPFQRLVALLYLLRFIFYLSYYIYLSFWLKQQKENFQGVELGLKIFYLITFFTTATQFFLYPDLRNLIYLGWDPHLNRAFGVFFDTSIAAAVFGLVILSEKNLFLKSAYFVLLIASFSRGLILSFFISLVYLIVVERKSFKIIGIVCLLIFVLLFLIPKPAGEGGKLTRLYTIFSRLNDYREGSQLFFSKPLFGYGYNYLRFVRNKGQSNAASNFSSTPLTILVSAGIVGLLAFFHFLSWFWRRFESKKPVILFLLVSSLFDNILFHPFILFLFFSNLLSDR
ncbi:MAG: hypothetical protein NZL96_03390 [Patescibacteria group bacterium]|nr:hypothetical protein [Patescibacteria group bacterium]